MTSKLVVNRTAICITLCVVIGAMLTVPGAARRQDTPLHENASQKVTLRGYIRDVACLMKYSDALKPSNGCAEMCARAGSPLVLATPDGTLYTPISESIPDSSVRDKLMPFVGSFVEVKGEVYERSSMKAIVIRQIAKADDPSDKRPR